MAEFDNSLTLYSSDIYIQKYADLINFYIESSQPFAIVGAYGLGKGIIADYLISLNGDNYQVAFIDLSLFINMTPGKFFAGLISAITQKGKPGNLLKEITEDEFYWGLTQALIKLHKKKLIIVLRHGGKLLRLPDSVIDRFNNFLYDNSKRVTIAITSSPRLINFPSQAVDSLVGNNYIYFDRLDDQTAIKDIKKQGEIFKTDFTAYEKDIIKYSHNVHGTIAFLCLVLSKYKPKKLNQDFIHKYIYTHPKLRIFFDTCFDSLTDEQVNIIQHYCLLHRLTKQDKESLAFKNLIRFNIFYKSGKTYKFIYELFSGFIIRFLSNAEAKSMAESVKPNFTNSYAQLLYKVNSSKVFSLEELRLMRLLIDKGGEIASFNEIAQAIWKNDNKFSMYAINKIISRIRVKIGSLENCKCLIVTKYKQGYYLVC